MHAGANAELARWAGSPILGALLSFAVGLVFLVVLAVFAAAVIAAQMLVALLVDRFGWLGVHERAITPGRVVGALLLVAGVACVRVF